MLISIAFSYVAVNYDIIVTPFSYNTKVSIEQLNEVVFLLIFCLVFYCFGYVSFYRNHSSVLEKSIKVKKKRIGLIVNRRWFYALFYLFSLFLFFLLIVIDKYNDGVVYVTINDRFFESKISQFSLLSVVFVLIYSSRNIGFFHIIITILISFFFAWFDSSRSAVIPISGLLIGFLIQRKYGKCAFSFLLLCFVYFFALESRQLYYKFDIDSFFNLFEVILKDISHVFLTQIGYVTSFSVLHFVYVNNIDKGVYEIADLIYSLSPLPASFMPFIQVDTDNWRIDSFRVIGGMGEVYRVSPFLLPVFYFFLGMLAKRISISKSVFISYFCALILFMSIIVFFQYSLRATHWFWILILMLLYFEKKVKV